MPSVYKIDDLPAPLVFPQSDLQPFICIFLQ